MFISDPKPTFLRSGFMIRMANGTRNLITTLRKKPRGAWRILTAQIFLLTHNLKPMTNEEKTSNVPRPTTHGSAYSFIPGSIDRDSLVNHCNHIRSILIANRKRTYVYFIIDPAYTAYIKRPDQQTEKHLRQALVKSINDYSDLFFDDQTLFLT